MKGSGKRKHRRPKAVLRKASTEEIEIMATQEQKRKERQKFRADFLRLLVIYPLAWIVVSVILFYLVKIN
jgi:hypothetical protein